MEKAQRREFLLFEEKKEEKQEFSFLQETKTNTSFEDKKVDAKPHPMSFFKRPSASLQTVFSHHKTVIEQKTSHTHSALSQNKVTEMKNEVQSIQPEVVINFEHHQFTAPGIPPPKTKRWRWRTPEFELYRLASLIAKHQSDSFDLPI